MPRRASQSLYHGGSNKNQPRRPSNINRPREGANPSGYISPRYAGGGLEASSNLLLPPNRGRSRGASLPGNMEDVNQEDIYRLRNFATSGKKVINRGDSIKASSRSNINSAGSRYEPYFYIRDLENVTICQNISNPNTTFLYPPHLILRRVHCS